MTTTNKIYITTTLPYANSVPHIGHALEFIQADALCRHFKKDNRVFFNVGVDEHGLKVWKKAQDEGVDVNDYLNQLSVKWIEFCHHFQIHYDSFYRTTSSTHYEKVTNFWEKCISRGDLYKKRYSGMYCVGCESFKTDGKSQDGLEGTRSKCPEHGTELEYIEEENWFFRLSNYKDKLVQWLDSSPDFLVPRAKREELRNQILEAEDISVSRVKNKVPWGIPVPNDPEQVIYVWFEALLNYVFATDKTNFRFDDWFIIQICGPDNIRFQGCIFQALLEADKLKHSDRLLVHGTILDENGVKMSKTRGNVIDPIDQLNKFGIDAVRYYALAGLTTCGNSNWSEADLVKLYNDEVCNEFGNLIARVLHLIDKQNVEISFRHTEPEFVKDLESRVQKANEYWANLDIYQALRETNQLSKLGNRYIGETKPWEGNSVSSLNNLYYLLMNLYALYIPVLGEQSLTKVHSAITSKKKEVIFPKILTEKSHDKDIVHN
jgi:methionyl-tRNA synthetase